METCRLASTLETSRKEAPRVRIAELSRETGVPVPTIKYYLREGLLPAGERTSPNQAQYGEEHIRRLKLVRALIDVGGLSVAAAREVLDRMATPGVSMLDSIGKAQYAMTAPREHVEDADRQQAVAQVDQLIERQGWRVRPTNPARQTLAEVLATLHRLGQSQHFPLLDDYAKAVRGLAAAEVDAIRQLSDVDTMAETVVVWTVLGDALLATMRRLAQEDAAEALLGDDSPRAN